MHFLGPVLNINIRYSALCNKMLNSLPNSRLPRASPLPTRAYKTATSLWNSLANQLAESDLDRHRRLEEALHTATMHWQTGKEQATHSCQTLCSLLKPLNKRRPCTLPSLKGKLTTMEGEPQTTTYKFNQGPILVESSLRGFKTLRTSHDNVQCTKAGGHQSSSCVSYSSYIWCMWVKLHKETSHRDGNI